MSHHIWDQLDEFLDHNGKVSPRVLSPYMVDPEAMDVRAFHQISVEELAYCFPDVYLFPEEQAISGGTFDADADSGS